mgnify:CR=1 FL=1
MQIYVFFQYDITFEKIRLLIDNEIKKQSEYSFISFYGGEPLLRKDLIHQTIDYINGKKCKTKFYFGLGIAEKGNVQRFAIYGEDIFFPIIHNNPISFYLLRHA